MYIHVTMNTQKTIIETESGIKHIVDLSVSEVKVVLIDAQKESNWAEFLINASEGRILYIKPFSVISLESFIVSF